MQVCNSLKKRIIGFSVLFAAGAFSSLFAESVEMPKMPQMPDMPSISNPSLDGNFYKPSIPYQPQKNKSEDMQTNNSSSSGAVLSAATSSDDIISSFLTSSQNTNLTANDISTLYDSGLFGNLSGLVNLSSGLQNTNSANVTSESTYKLLQQVLESLEELKKEQKKASYAEKNNLSNYQQDSQTFKKREPSVLRFKINGYSMTESFTKVFFSEPESDGTFLLSADRKYYANQKPREETLYLLFRAEKSTGSTVLYNVQPSVVQSEKNDASYIYKFAQLKNLKAEKTGNLVAMHTESGDVSVDMLLDIDNK